MQHLIFAFTMATTNGNWILSAVLAGLILVAFAVLRVVPFGMQVTPAAPAAAAPPAAVEPEKVDVEKVAPTLDDKQLEDLLEHPEKVEVLKPGEKPSETKPTPTPSATETEAEKAARVAAETAAAEAAKNKTPEKLYAGTFKTTDELKKGLLNVGKPLNYDPAVLEAVVELAEKTGDWTKAEKVYEALNKAVSANQKVPAADPNKPAASATPEKENLLTVTDEEQREIGQVVLEQTYATVETTAVARQLRELGIEIPKTKEAWNELQRDYPFYAMKLDQVITATFKQIAEETKNFLTAERDAVTHNQTTQDAELKKIKDYAVQVGLPAITDAEVKAIVEAALKNPAAFESRHGVSFLRQGGIYDHWYLSNREKIEKQIQLKAEADGRAQATKDIKEMGKKSLSTISTNHVPASQAEREKKGKIDPSDPTQLGALTEEQLEQGIKNGIESIT